MTPPPPKIAYLTAGAAGMYCGSCLHDNTLAAALHRLGIDVQLIPVYTPIRTDEEDRSLDRVFLGGINVFLQQRFAWARHLPLSVSRVLDRPALLRWAASRARPPHPSRLGEMTVSMLRGHSGRQGREVQKLCRWLADSAQPQLINLTNMLIAGCVGALKESLAVPVLVTLQGDDLFLEQLVEPYRGRALAEIRRLVSQVDGFLVFSRYYADFMADYFQIPRNKLHIVPLGIATDDFAHLQLSAVDAGREDQQRGRPPTVGYLARLAPEKGLHLLVDAFLELRKRPGMAEAQLHVAGWLGKEHRGYAEQQFDKLAAAGLAEALKYEGTVDRQGKVGFLSRLDVFSVPTTYQEPKGLYVLEALAAGVPVVQPDHGAFPELLAATGGGRLVRPEDPRQLADQWHALLTDRQLRQQLGRQGQAAVHQRFHGRAMALATLRVYAKYLDFDVPDG